MDILVMVTAVIVAGQVGTADSDQRYRKQTSVVESPHELTDRAPSVTPLPANADTDAQRRISPRLPRPMRPSCGERSARIPVPLKFRAGR